MVQIRDWTKSTFDPEADIEINKIFRMAVKMGCSDIHLQVGQPPILRIRGTLTPLEMPPLTESQMIKLTFPMMDQRNLDIFQRDGGSDFSKVVDYKAEPWRFRVNLLTQLGLVGMVARKVERDIPPFENLYLPPIMESLCKFDQGMVLLAGVTGSGKSTTIASMLNWINQNMNRHILTIEDPIEFVYTSDQCLINQREIGMDVIDFHVAMKHAVREDPDIMLVGEMRDQETFEAALHAAETGHLVFGTIHSSSTTQTFSRVYGLFPAEEVEQVRKILGYQMRAFVYQKLLPTLHEKIFRIPALEILINNGVVQKYILDEREGEIREILNSIEAKQQGMIDFNDSLVKLVEDEYIHMRTAIEASPNVDELQMKLKKFN